MNIEKRFDNQIAVVTGGAAGIGQAVAVRLRDEGAQVVIFDQDVSGQKPNEAVQVDIADSGQVQTAFTNVQMHHGKIDVVVHCAGIVGPNNTRVQDVSVEEFDRVYNINLRGSFLVLKHALPSMLERNYGRILLFASIAGKEGNAGMTPYSATKAGVIGLVKAAGKEVATTGVTINAIAPAVIRTSMVETMHPDQVKYMTDKIPAKRCGTLDEASALACWAVSAEASFCTGFCFDLTGGRATY